ncbi:MAG TPA: hypothetical protein VGV61_02505 [Thermoanaerobaculia bacterium]|nr:hypothetical protein [Thermoanaerobaculia bacterium]
MAWQAPFWAGIPLSLSLCLDLGLVNAAVFNTAIERGGGAGFLVGLGSGLGDLGFFLGGLAWSAFLAYATALLRRALGDRLGRWLALASALLFAGLAVWVFVRRLHELARH